jgi:hypothetical protein
MDSRLMSASLSLPGETIDAAPNPLVFTLPAEVAPIAYQNKAVVYDCGSAQRPRRCSPSQLRVCAALPPLECAWVKGSSGNKRAI